MNPDEVKCVWAWQELFVMVAFILHLGNVTFDDDDEGFAVVSSDETLHIIDTVRTTCSCLAARPVKAKFHYTSWFGAGSKLV